MASKLNISKIEISNLFDMFSYDIELNDDLTILTSPNGYGKSTILRMINNFTTGNYYSFLHESFNKVVFHLVENEGRSERKHKQLELLNHFMGTKDIKDQDEIINLFGFNFEDETTRHKIEVIKNNRVVTISDLTKDDSPTTIVELPPESEFSVIVSSIEAKNPITRIEYDSWTDDFTGEIYDFKGLVARYNSTLNEEVRGRIFKNTAWLDSIIKNVNSYFISTDRIKSNVVRNRRHSRNEKSASMIKNLAMIISDKIQEGIRNQFDIGREKETTFPERLIKLLKSDDKFVTQHELLSLINDIQKYESKFSKLGLISDTNSRTTNLLNDFFDYENSSTGNVVLKIYLDDIKSKFKALDTLSNQLRLFTETLNKLLSFKEIKVNLKKGFTVQPSNGKKDIDISELSSGEQHIIIMIGKLIFESKKGDLILIDEPEISLHPEWQEAYIDSLEEIRKEREFRILMATHSTMIIGHRWDEVIELSATSNEVNPHE
ncbi:AAA family ATPase [Enterobacter quasiroggenkampii]|uniref:AAA family ATPase n=1 Tax=Enterobacter quasiroggenkampii TaxID=2497436 RepID=A0ABY8E292_9ENTR|nr:AAA family ATPase [Enterobacter quasiroggenkampii]WFC81239.1 AAA family ATPase [Enterobacter quasiroggenkampii]